MINPGNEKLDRHQDEPTDEALLVAYLDQNGRDELARLIERYESQAYGLAMRICGSAADAEDATQNAFLEMIKSLTSFRRDAKFAPWFLKIVVRCARRSAAARRSAEEKASKAAEAHMIREHPDNAPQAVAISAEEIRLVDEALARLPEKLRLPVLLRYRHGLDGLQAAAVLECPENTFRTWLKRGMEALREALGDAARNEDRLAGVVAALPLATTPSTLHGTLTQLAHGSVSGSAKVWSAPASAMPKGLAAKGMYLMKAHPLTAVAISLGLAGVAAVVTPNIGGEADVPARKGAANQETEGEGPKPTPALERKETPVEDARTKRIRLAGSFCSKLTTLIGSGVPLRGALQILAAETPDPDSKKAYTTLHEGLATSPKLDEMMAKYPKLFPARLVQISKPVRGGMPLQYDKSLKRLGDVFLVELEDAATPARNAEHERVLKLKLFFMSLGAAMESGYPIVSSLNAIAEDLEEGELKQAVIGISKDLVAGEALAGPMAKRSAIFPSYTTMVVRTGEVTGELDRVNKEIVELLRFQAVGDSTPAADRIKLAEVSAVMTCLSYEVKAGKAPHQTLSRLAPFASTEDMRKALNAAASAVKGGATLSDALKAQPKVFGPSVYWMVRLGEKGNVLDQCLKRIGAQLGREVGTGTSLADAPFVKISGSGGAGGEDDF